MTRGKAADQLVMNSVSMQDTTTGQVVATHRTRQGPCGVLRQNPWNAVLLTGHGNGTVHMWTPNMAQAAVKMLCHMVQVPCLLSWVSSPVPAWLRVCGHLRPVMGTMGPRLWPACGLCSNGDEQTLDKGRCTNSTACIPAMQLGCALPSCMRAGPASSVWCPACRPAQPCAASREQESNVPCRAHMHAHAQSLRWACVQGPVSAMAVDPTGRQLVTAGADSQIKASPYLQAASIYMCICILTGCLPVVPPSALPHPSMEMVMHPCVHSPQSTLDPTQSTGVAS